MPLQLFKIAETIVSTPQSNIEFTSIPQGYTDLLVFTSVKTNGGSEGNEGINMNFNGSTSGYSGKILHGSGSAGVATYGTAATTFRIIAGAANTGESVNTFSNSSVHILNYSGSQNKAISVDSVTERTAALAYQLTGAVLWSNTSAITSIRVTMGDGTAFLTNSSISLYGIL